MGNPCDTPMVRKLYRERVVSRWEIIEKETVDEIIFRTVKARHRLILELMARGGMRIGEVLKLRLNDIQDRKLILRESKSGNEHEIVFIPQKVADRLREYATKKGKSPHDLRRHSATCASRSGVPIEIVSNVILRHANHATTQRYLGTISDTEAIRWIENLYG